MQFNPNKLGIAVAIASLIYQILMLIITMILTTLQGQINPLALLTGMALASIAFTCVLHYTYAFIFATAYNRLMS